jgi:hypothetical protein
VLSPNDFDVAALQPCLVIFEPVGCINNLGVRPLFVQHALGSTNDGLAAIVIDAAYANEQNLQIPGGLSFFYFHSSFSRVKACQRILSVESVLDDITSALTNCI